MSDLISREEVKLEVARAINDARNNGWDTVCCIYNAINNVPEAINDVPEPKTGKWIVDRYCSECEWDKQDASYTSSWSDNYCPNCGAKMKGESNEEEVD